MTVEIPDKEKRILKVIESRSVKLHKFLPSGREIWTVIGQEGDYLVDEEGPYCSCDDFYFRVLGGKEDFCYHLLSASRCKEKGLYDAIEFDDEEYQSFLSLLVRDIRRNFEQNK